MSLINDAIKRAGQNPPPTSDPVATAAGMRPVEYQRPSRFPWVVVLAVLAPVFGVAIWFIAKGWQLSQSPRSGANELVANARSQAVGPAVTPDPTAAFQVPQAAASLQPGTAVVHTTVVTNVMEPAKPSFPSLKLQGIYWRPSRPSAVINSKTVYLGDKVESVRVTAIDHESVTVQWESETKVLTLR